jgi:hypothetical protein
MCRIPFARWGHIYCEKEVSLAKTLPKKKYSSRGYGLRDLAPSDFHHFISLRE